MFLENLISFRVKDGEKTEFSIFSWLLMLTILFLVFKPSQLITGNLYFPVYSLAVFAGIILCNQMFLLDRAPKIFKLIALLCFILSINTLISLVYSSQVNSRIMLTWPAWFCVLCLGYFLALKTKGVDSLVPFLFKLVITIQSMLALIQLFEPNAFNLLWSSIKTQGLDQAVRVTGSLYNPNFFAFVVTFSLAAIVANKGPEREWHWVVLGYSLVILSGSRTFILGYPLVIASWYYLSMETTLYQRVISTIFWVLGLYAFGILVMALFKENLYYSTQLFSMVNFDNLSESSGLNAIRSYETRTSLWDTNLAEFFDGNVMQMLFGKHGGYELNPHNSLVYVLTRFGFMGFFIYAFLLFLLLSAAYQLKKFFEGRFLYMACLTIIGFGLTDISSATMTMGIFLALTAGIAFSKLSPSQNKQLIPFELKYLNSQFRISDQA